MKSLKNSEIYFLSAVIFAAALFLAITDYITPKNPESPQTWETFCQLYDYPTENPTDQQLQDFADYLARTEAEESDF